MTNPPFGTDLTGFRLDPKDEYPHQPYEVVNFNESVYGNAFDFGQKVGGWMRLGNRVNEGYAELSVCLYLSDGRIACQFKRPSIESNDAFDAGGLRVDVVEPLTRVDMTYEGELLVLDNPDQLRDPAAMFERAPRAESWVRFSQTAVSPAYGGEPTTPEQQTLYGHNFSRSHFNQHTRVAGSMRVGDDEWSIDGFGWRDHSWGPRYWQEIYWYRLFMGNVSKDRGFMLLKIVDADGRPRRLGVLRIGNEYEPVLDLDVTTEWSAEQDPQRILIGVRTPNRQEVIQGRSLTVAPLRNRRRTDDGELLVSRIAEAFTEFTWNGETGYGMSEYIERLEDGSPVGYPL